MKKLTTSFIVIMLMLSAHISSSQSREDIFKKETPLTWLGVDFSEARYLGDPGTVDSGEMKDLFYKINQLILAEPDKYNLRKSFYKSYITPNLSVVEKVNGGIDASKIMSGDYNDYSRLNAEKVQAMVGRYDFTNVNGIAAVIIMEAMNKSTSQAAMWVTFVNTADKKVLLTARITGKSGGFGFRNHWAGSIHKVLEMVRSKHYKNWQKNKQ